MRIPLAYSDIGFFVKSQYSNTYYFVLENASYCGKYYHKYKKGTFREFLELYPYTVSKSGANSQYRVKDKKDRI